ncbi:hypothetical protein GCM10027418_02890 [Mariniluteicoccus endophyticus]
MRDLLVLGDLVVACDSIGGIGPLPGDTVSADATTVGHFALRVPLMEVLCAGADPVAVVDALSLPLAGAGEEIVAEVRRLAAEAGVPPEAVTGSTEENVPVTATGIGVTVLGRLRGAPTTARPGDAVVCLGLPLSAPRDTLHPGHPGQVTVADVRAVLATGLVHDALPVGSRGVAYELGELARTAGLRVEPVGSDVSPTDSGGPASCVLVACAADDLDALRAATVGDPPFAVVARLVG